MRRALLLDLDGTLAQSLGVMRRAYARLLAEHGRQGSDEEFERLNGPPLREGARLLRATHGLGISQEALVTRWFELIAAEYKAVPTADGAEELLSAARQAGWLTAVVTSSSMALASEWLATVGLADAIDAVIGMEAVSRGKPNPDPYLEAMRCLRVEAGQCIAVEDSPSGAQAAQAAGASTYVLARSSAGPWPSAAHHVETLADLVPVLRGRKS